MPREQGKDPTPQGRMPRQVPRPGSPRLDQTPHLAETDAEKFQHSAPGPDTRADGAFWYGRKNKRTDHRVDE